MTSKPPSFRPPLNASRREQDEWEKQMLRWLSNRIEEQIVRENQEANANAPTREELCIMSARAGDPEGLRKLYPHFADCIHSPKLRPGQKYRKAFYTLSVPKTAAEYTKRIQALWREHYGKAYRRRDEKSAADFAVEIVKEWFGGEAAGLSVEAVLAAAKPSGERKPKSK